MFLIIYVNHDIIRTKVHFYKTFRAFGGLLKSLQCLNSKFGGNSMLTVTSLESVLIDFPDNQKILDRLFGPDGSGFGSCWFEVVQKNFSSLIEELTDSTDEEEKFLRQQCMIAREIIAFAQNSGSEPHMVYQDDNTLVFQFAFEEAEHAFLFQSTLRDYVQEATGLQL